MANRRVGDSGNAAVEHWIHGRSVEIVHGRGNNERAVNGAKPDVSVLKMDIKISRKAHSVVFTVSGTRR